MFEVLLLSDF